jgi:hypothetical protein
VGLGDDAVVVAASLTTLTTPEVGYEQQPNTNLPSDILPLWVGASIWAVQFTGIEIPVTGHSTGGTSTYSSGLVVFIDAYDGSLMMATDADG